MIPSAATTCFQFSFGDGHLFGRCCNHQRFNQFCLKMVPCSDSSRFRTSCRESPWANLNLISAFSVTPRENQKFFVVKICSQSSVEARSISRKTLESSINTCKQCNLQKQTATKILCQHDIMTSPKVSKQCNTTKTSQQHCQISTITKQPINKHKYPHTHTKKLYFFNI